MHISFQYFPRNDSLLKSVANHEDLQKLIRFSQEFYTIEKHNDTLVFNNLRLVRSLAEKIQKKSLFSIIIFSIQKIIPLLFKEGALPNGIGKRKKAYGEDLREIN